MGEILHRLALEDALAAHEAVDGGVVKIQTCNEWVTFPDCGQLVVTFTGVTKCPGVAGTGKDWPSDINTTFILPYVCSSVLQDCDERFEVTAGGWTIFACIDRVTKDLYIGSYYTCPACGTGRGTAGHAIFQESNCTSTQGYILGACGFVGNLSSSCNTRHLCTDTGFGGAASWQYETTGC